MVLNPNTLIVKDLRDGIPSKGDCRHAVKKFGALVTEFDSVHRVPLPPVQLFVMQESFKLSLDK
jgi:hypothetical protein